MHNNLIHVLGPECTDPDCEIHNIVVAAEEMVLGEGDFAMWFAGAMYEAKHPGEAIVELTKAIAALSYTDGRLEEQTNEPRTLETDLLEDR
jgi:hypothetical protein